jgi:hypothetical protein
MFLRRYLWAKHLEKAVDQSFAHSLLAKAVVPQESILISVGKYQSE